MDWTRGTHDAATLNRSEPPAATLVEICWYIRTPNAKLITCGVYRDSAPGFDVRAQFAADDLLRSHRVPAIGTARELATKWKDAILAKGTFIEVTEAGGPQ